jgi:hypothetical protein
MVTFSGDDLDRCTTWLPVCAPLVCATHHLVGQELFLLHCGGTVLGSLEGLWSHSSVWSPCRCNRWITIPVTVSEKLMVVSRPGHKVGFGER